MTRILQIGFNFCYTAIAMSRFYLIRHAHSQVQENNVMPDKNSPLSLKGIQQAKERGKTLKKVQFDIAFSSDSLRSYQTALYILLSQKQAIPLIIANKLREKLWGGLEGKNYEEINKKIYEKKRLFATLPDQKKLLFKYNEEAESDEETCLRLIKSLKEINEKYKNKTILIVTHGTIMRNFLIKTTETTYAELPSGSNINNVGYLVADFNGINFRHLDHVGVKKKMSVKKTA